MNYANIYKVTTGIGPRTYTKYVVARSFGEAFSLANEKDDKVTKIKYVAEKVDLRHLLEKPVPERAEPVFDDPAAGLPVFPDSETSN